MKKKTSKEILFERFEKVDPTFKRRVNEDAFNSAGEPKMTHSQFRDYSEPAEPEYDDNDGYYRNTTKPMVYDWEGFYSALTDENDNLNVNSATAPDGVMNKVALEILLDTSIRIPEAYWGIGVNDDGTLFLDAYEENIPSFNEFKDKITKVLNNPEKYQSGSRVDDEDRYAGKGYFEENKEGFDNKNYNPNGKIASDINFNTDDLSSFSQYQLKDMLISKDKLRNDLINSKEINKVINNKYKYIGDIFNKIIEQAIYNYLTNRGANLNDFFIPLDIKEEILSKTFNDFNLNELLKRYFKDQQW